MGRPNLKFLFLSFGIFGFLFFHLAQQMLQVRPDGWYVGQVNLYGDLVFHLGFINKFLQSKSILVGSPIYAGEKPNYPLFADFITAQIAKLTGVDVALFITTFLMGLVVIFTIRLFIFNFIKNEKIVFLTLLIFFLNGGFGFYYFFQDFRNNQKPLLDFILHLPHEYTDLKTQGYWWINNLLAYFLPQRGFLFAFPITLTVLSLRYVGCQKAKRYFFALAGLLAGLLPLVQAHSLFLLFILSIYFVTIIIITSKDRLNAVVNWLLFGILTSVISVPIFRLISKSYNFTKFIRFDPGWTSQENIIWFWLKNLGLFGPVLVIATIWLFKKNRHLFSFYIPFLAVFVLSNIFIFQPWEFDNSKLLIYWFFASSIVVAYFMYDQFFSENLNRKIIGAVIVILMVFSGFLDITRTFTPATNYQIFTKNDLDIASLVKNLTLKDSIFVTSSAHNHPIPALTGRSTLLGFHGWAWSHGLDYQTRANDITLIYLGGDKAGNLIRFYKINYVTIGPLEKSEFSINESYFEKFPKIPLTLNWSIYDVRNLWSNGNR